MFSPYRILRALVTSLIATALINLLVAVFPTGCSAGPRLPGAGDHGPDPAARISGAPAVYSYSWPVTRPPIPGEVGGKAGPCIEEGRMSPSSKHVTMSGVTMQ